jgi:hypothetical protein
MYRSLRIIQLATLFGLGVATSACHSTHLAATWQEPNGVPLRFKQPITVFISNSETFRHQMEDKLASEFPGAVPSYRILGSANLNDGAEVRKRLADAGYDGAIIMRVVNVDQQLTYSPGTYWSGAPYRSFSGYWGSSWGYPYDPGYVNEDVIVSVETQVYSLRDDHMVWAARSETTNPSSVRKLGNSVVKHVVRAMKKDGVMAGQ